MKAASNERCRSRGRLRAAHVAYIMAFAALAASCSVQGDATSTSRAERSTEPRDFGQTDQETPAMETGNPSVPTTTASDGGPSRSPDRPAEPAPLDPSVLEPVLSSLEEFFPNGGMTTAERTLLTSSIATACTRVREGEESRLAPGATVELMLQDLGLSSREGVPEPTIPAIERYLSFGGCGRSAHLEAVAAILQSLH